MSFKTASQTIAAIILSLSLCALPAGAQSSTEPQDPADTTAKDSPQGTAPAEPVKSQEELEEELAALKKKLSDLEAKQKELAEQGGNPQSSGGAVGGLKDVNKTIDGQGAAANPDGSGTPGASGNPDGSATPEEPTLGSKILDKAIDIIGDLISSLLESLLSGGDSADADKLDGLGGDLDDFTGNNGTGTGGLPTDGGGLGGGDVPGGFGNPIDSNGDGVADGFDIDGDGQADFFDTNGDGIPDSSTNNGSGSGGNGGGNGGGFGNPIDSNGDGIVDGFDIDGDGQADIFDTDGDGQPDSSNNGSSSGGNFGDPIDSNGDGKVDGFDRDGDGVADVFDTDGDGIPDAFDSDGDGRPDAFDSDGDGRPDSFDSDGDGTIDTGPGAGGGGGSDGGSDGGSGDGFGKFNENPEGKGGLPGDSKDGPAAGGSGSAGTPGISGANSTTGKDLEKATKIITGRVLLLPKIESEDLGLAGEAEEGSDEDFLDDLDKPKEEEKIDSEKQKEKILDDVIRIETVLDKWRKLAKAKKEGDVDVYALEKAKNNDLPRDTKGELDYSKIEIWIIVDWEESEPKRYRVTFTMESDFSPAQGAQVAVKGSIEKVELPQDILDEIGGTVHGLEFDSVVLSAEEDDDEALDLDGPSKKDTKDLGDLDDLDDLDD